MSNMRGIQLWIDFQFAARNPLRSVRNGLRNHGTPLRNRALGNSQGATGRGSITVELQHVGFIHAPQGTAC